MSRSWQDPSSQTYMLFETLATISVETSEGRVAHCAAKYLLANDWTRNSTHNPLQNLIRSNVVQCRQHYHYIRGGRCADYLITSSGMSFLKARGVVLGTITWRGFPETVSRTPKKEAKVMDETKKPVEPTPTERISVPGVMTEKEKTAAEFLLARAQEVGSNGTSEKRVVNPAEMLEAEGLVQNLPAAISIVSILEQHGVLRACGQQMRNDDVLYIYVVKDMALEFVKTVSLSGLQKDLRKLLRESQRKVSKLRDKRNTLRAEREQINVGISALDAEMEKVSAEEGAIKAKLAKFDNLLRELSRELSL